LKERLRSWLEGAPDDVAAELFFSGGAGELFLGFRFPPRKETQLFLAEALIVLDLGVGSAEDSLGRTDAALRAISGLERLFLGEPAFMGRSALSTAGRASGPFASGREGLSRLWRPSAWPCKGEEETLTAPFLFLWSWNGPSPSPYPTGSDCPSRRRQPTATASTASWPRRPWLPYCGDFRRLCFSAFVGAPLIGALFLWAGSLRVR